jgi:hypothetical protein
MSGPDTAIKGLHSSDCQNNGAEGKHCCDAELAGNRQHHCIHFFISPKSKSPMGHVRLKDAVPAAKSLPWPSTLNLRNSQADKSVKARRNKWKDLVPPA